MDSKVIVAVDEKCRDNAKLENEVRKLTQQYEEMHEAFLLQSGKTAESVLELCSVVQAARVRLVHFPKQLADFRKNTKLTNKSTFSQYCTIGMNYETLFPHASRLPASWYALYRIARLKDEVREKALASGKIHPAMTQRELEKLVGKTGKKQLALRSLLIWVRDEAPGDVLFQIQEEISEMVKRHQESVFAVVPSKKWKKSVRLTETLKKAA